MPDCHVASVFQGIFAVVLDVHLVYFLVLIEKILKGLLGLKMKKYRGVSIPKVVDKEDLLEGLRVRFCSSCWPGCRGLSCDMCIFSGSNKHLFKEAIGVGNDL